MSKPSTQILEKARRALLEGNRSEVERLLRDHLDSSHSESRWLLAAAVEDQAVRREHLQAVVNSRTSPYAQRAEDILNREQMLESEMTRAPRWQRYLVRHRKSIIGLIALGVVLIGIWIVTGLNTTDAEQRTAVQATIQAVSQAATETATHQPPSATATATFFPPALITHVSYPPFGSLRILTVEFPSLRTVIDARNGAVQTPPVNSAFAAIVYEFTCGSGEAAFCTQPPEAGVSLLLGNGQRVPQTSLNVDDPTIPIPGVLPTGSVVRGWLVFPVPNGQVPTALLLTANTDATTQALEEIVVALWPTPDKME